MNIKTLFATTWSEVGIIALTALGIYLAVILLTRICGKRSFSKMSSFDFAMTVAVGSIIATTVLTSSVKLIDGLVGLTAVYALQMIIAVGRRSQFVEKLVDNSPLLLMEGEHVLDDNLRKARVSESDLRSKLREANITRLSQIKAVVFETTGVISVMHQEVPEPLDPWLMKDVQRN